MTLLGSSIESYIQLFPIPSFPQTAVLTQNPLPCATINEKSPPRLLMVDSALKERTEELRPARPKSTMAWTLEHPLAQRSWPPEEELSHWDEE